MTSSMYPGELDRPLDTPTAQLSSRPASRPTSIQPSPPTQHTISPPNEPRRSLSTQLAPDYSSWVNDISTPSNPTPTNKSNKQSKGRGRRENQPSFTGSALTVSDLDEDPNPNHHDVEQDTYNESEHEPAYTGIDNDSGIGRRPRNPQQQEAASGTSEGGSSLASGQSLPASSSSSSTRSKPPPRLRPLNKSRVESTDPSRPAYKLGPPLSTPPQPASSSPPKFPSSLSSSYSPPPSSSKVSPLENFNETSALLGGKPRNPQGNGERWTNKGSGRRAPRYDGQDYRNEDQVGDDHDDHDLDENSDLLRRPSR